eukprot:Polyplicarium_translucidae@DN3260_c1_g1_i2.p1
MQPLPRSSRTSRTRAEKRIFTAASVTAAFLTKLKEMAEISTRETVKDVVIAVPGWFRDIHRQAVIDAAEIAGLNCLRTINEHAAVMLDFGIYRARTFDESKPCRVAFVSLGHGNAWVGVGEFRPGEFRVLSAEYDPQLGGRDFDEILITHCAEHFQSKYKVNPLESKKARLKLEEACSKAKKVLSANKEAHVNVEFLVEDMDLNVTISRADFEKMSISFQARFKGLMEQAVAASMLSVGDIESVEIVGGGIRIPWVQDSIKAFFGKELSRTLHGDESVARGAALQAAMLNPRYKVREFAVNDKYFNHVCLNYISNTPNEGGDLPTKTYTLFDAKSGLNVRKYVTLQRDDSFDTWIAYEDKEGQPKGDEDQVIGSYHVEVPPKRTTGPSGGNITSRKIKLRVVLSLHGITHIDNACLVEEEAVKEMVKEKRPKAQADAAAVPAAAPAPAEEPKSEPVPESAPDTDMTPPEAPAVPTPPQIEYEEFDVLKESTKVHRTNLNMASKALLGWHSRETVQELQACEAAIAAEDRRQRETRDVMNALESYAYQMRDRLQTSLAGYMSEQAETKFTESLGRVSDWIYEVGASATKEEFEAKLKELKVVGDVIENFYDERQGCPALANKLFTLLRQSVMACESEDNAHVPESARVEVMAKAQLAEAWLTEALDQSNRVPLHEAPTLTMATVEAQEKEFTEYYAARMNVPKSQPEEPKKVEEGPGESGDAEMPAADPASTSA